MATGLHHPGEAQVHHIVELSDLDSLAGAWDRLASRSGSPIGQYIWARACAEALGDRYSLDVVALGPRERPIAIAPLARRRRPLAPLELLGVHELREPMDFLYADAPAAAALVRALASLPGPLSLKRFPAGSLALAAVDDAYRKRGLVLNREAGACPYIPLGGPHTEPEQELSARRRSDLRRAQRRADRLGEVNCEVRSPTPAELDPLLEEAFGSRGGWLEGEGAHSAEPRPDPPVLLPSLRRRCLLEGHPSALLPADRRPGRRHAARGRDRRSVLAAQGGLRRAVRALLTGLAAVAGDHPVRNDTGSTLV